MYLHQQYPPQSFKQLTVVDLEHGHHGNVRCTSLDWRVDARPQGVPEGLHVIFFHCVGQVTIPSHQRSRHTVFFGHILRVFLPFLHLGSRLVPGLKHLFRLLRRNPPILTQSVGGLPIRDRKVERLCLSPLRCILILQHGLVWFFAVRVIPLEQNFAIFHGVLNVSEHSQRCPGVEVPAGLECFYHRRAICHARKQP